MTDTDASFDDVEVLINAIDGEVDLVAAAQRAIAASPPTEERLETLWERAAAAAPSPLRQRILAIRPDLLRCHARHAGGFEPVATSPEVRAWIAAPQCAPAQVLPIDLRAASTMVISLADGAPATRFPSGPRGAAASWQWIREEMAAVGAQVAIGSYGEDRSCYAGEQFTTDAPEPRSVHLGIDLFIDDGTPVGSALAGIVETVVDNDLPFDYGPTVIVRHTTPTGTPFWVLYGHLSRRTMRTVTPGQSLAAGATLGFVGSPEENGGWAPHVHVQVITHLLAARWDDPAAPPDGNFEGAGEPSRMTVWSSIVPDPSALLGI